MSRCTLPCLKLEQRGSVLWTFLNRPKKRNAIDKTLAHSIKALFDSPIPKTTRAIVLASTTPGVFCAGGDLRWMSTAPKRELSLIWDALRSIQTCKVPVIGRIDGKVAGGGAGLVAACDVAYTATDNAQIAMREVRVGLVPAMVSSFLVGKMAGNRATLTKMFITGEALNGNEACRAGLTNAHYTCTKDMDAAINKFCGEINKCSPEAVTRTKRLIVESYDRIIAGSRNPHDVTRLRSHLAGELERARNTRDGKEGIAAFFGKRSPQWSYDE